MVKWVFESFTVAGPVKAMRAEGLFRKSDGLHYLFHTVKTEGTHIEFTPYIFHHTGMLGTAPAGVFVQIYRLRFLFFLDKFAGNQLQTGSG